MTSPTPETIFSDPSEKKVVFVGFPVVVVVVVVVVEVVPELPKINPPIKHIRQGVFQIEVEKFK